jgi:hypothetical protein
LPSLFTCKSLKHLKTLHNSRISCHIPAITLRRPSSDRSKFTNGRLSSSRMTFSWPCSPTSLSPSRAARASPVRASGTCSYLRAAAERNRPSESLITTPPAPVQEEDRKDASMLTDPMFLRSCPPARHPWRYLHLGFQTDELLDHGGDMGRFINQKIPTNGMRSGSM